MQLGARVAFDRLDELESRLAGIDYPIELALPFRVVEFLPIAQRMAEVRECVRRRGVKVLSVHATQGDLSRDDCWEWARPAMRLADELGASSVTFHPGRAKNSRLSLQQSMLQNLRILRREFKAIPAVETFTDKQRLLLPEEIVTMSLHMVLDTSHIHEDARIFGLLDQHHDKVVTVHLSARGQGRQHQPIDESCIGVVRKLMKLGWQGAIVLEYLPEHQDRIRADSDQLACLVKGHRS